MPGPVAADQGGQAVTGPVGVNPWTLPPWPAQQWEQGSKKASGQLDPSVSAPSAEGPDWDLPHPVWLPFIPCLGGIRCLPQVLAAGQDRKPVQSLARFYR